MPARTWNCGWPAGLPRANAVKHVHEAHGVNMLATICAIDRAALPPLMDYWVPGVDVTGLHELVANALIIPGEQKRTTDLRRKNHCRMNGVMPMNE
jgi:hypothetical protein